MSTVLQFTASSRTGSRKVPHVSGGVCEIVIFPGVRIERHDHDADLNLAHRLRDAAGRGNFDGIGGGRRPRKTS